MAGSDDVQQQRDIGKLWGAITEIRTALIGLDGRNGMRGELRGFMAETRERLEKLEHTEAHASVNCIGKKALAEYEAKLEARLEEKQGERRHTDTIAVELTRTRNTFLAAILVALITTMGAITQTYLSAAKVSTMKETVRVLQEATP